MRSIVDLRQYGGWWTILWRDSFKKQRQKRLGAVATVSRGDATKAAEVFLSELAEYGDPLENRLAVKVKWPAGMQSRSNHKLCVFCGDRTKERLVGYAVCWVCGNRKREWEFKECLECRRKFPIMREFRNAAANIRYCPDCKEREFVEDRRFRGSC